MPPTQKPNKILVVDDEAQYRGMIKDLLDSQYTVKTVASGEEGISCLPDFEPDLILLDVVLPGINGYETCRLIRKNQLYGFVKIIMVSGKLEIGERLEGYDAGVDDYITKPFDCDELRHKVRIFLHLKRIEEVDNISGYLLRRFSIESRTPLNGIIAPAESILRNNLPMDQILQLAGIIQESSHRLLEFVRKATLFCDLKKGMRPRLSVGILKSHLQLLIQTHAVQASHKLVTIENTMSEDITLTVDWELIDKAMGFILENAIQYSPYSAIVGIKVSWHDDYVQIAISDQGEGIQPDLIDKLFDAHRCMQSLASLEECKGFSLLIAKHIIDLHGGAISAFNNPHKGSTFYITLPLTG